MNARRTLAAGLLALSLSTACLPGEMGDMFEFALDWALSDDPGLRAAATAGAEVEADEVARQFFAQGLETLDADAFRNAATVRPADPRYWVYEGAIHTAVGRGEAGIQANQRAIEALEALHPEAGEEEIRRRWAELYLESTRDLILNGGAGNPQQELRENYCTILTSEYPTIFGGSADAAVFLATADYSICE